MEANLSQGRAPNGAPEDVEGVWDRASRGLRPSRAATAVALIALVALPACEPAAPEAPPEPAQPQARAGPGPHDVAVITVKGMGEIHVELLPEVAPATVANFAKLANEAFYDGTTFHRVIPGFMIQGGDPNSRDNDPRNDGKGGPDHDLKDEFTDYPHLRGTVSMANTGYTDSGGSQFFIVQQDSTGIDGKYAAFGRVVKGIEIVDAITEVEIDTYGRWGPRDRPYPEDVVMESIRIVPAAEAAAEAARTAALASEEAEGGGDG